MKYVKNDFTSNLIGIATAFGSEKFVIEKNPCRGKYKGKFDYFVSIGHIAIYLGIGMKGAENGAREFRERLDHFARNKNRYDKEALEYFKKKHGKVIQNVYFEWYGEEDYFFKSKVYLTKIKMIVEFENGHKIVCPNSNIDVFLTCGEDFCNRTLIDELNRSEQFMFSSARTYRPELVCKVSA